MLPSLIRAAVVADVPAASSPFDVNQQPVIGIVSQTLPNSLIKDPRFAGKTSYMMQAYVDWAKEAGARVIPLIREDS